MDSFVGAYYYWITEDEKDYQTTIVDVVKTSNKTLIPYRYVSGGHFLVNLENELELTV